MFNIHYVIRVMPLLSAVLLAYGATTVFHYYSEERKRIKIRERFASYVPEKIIEQIVDADIEALTEGEQREVALLFSDIREFTTYSEKHKSDPKRIVGFLNQYHKEMTEIILSNNGTVAQLIGDGIFAFFGAPVELSDPIFSALKSAVQMKDKIIELRPKWRDYGMEDLRIGIGIHAGDTIVGNIGSVKKMAYVAIGDNTNIASRIEGLTKEFHETILISEAAYEPIRDRIYARPLGQVEIKGHSGIDIFAVDGMKG
jgi:adenylate cyclase